MYRIQKRMDFRDIREQNRILYNHETHIVKDIILLIICIAEMGEPHSGLKPKLAGNSYPGDR